MSTENNSIPSEPKSVNTNETEEGSLRWQDILDIIVVRRWWIAASVVFCVLLAALYVQHSTPTYTRSSTILVKDETKGADISNVAGQLSDLGMFNTKSSVENELQALSSPYLMYMVVRNLNLEVNYQEREFLRLNDLYGTNPIEAMMPNVHESEVFSYKVKLVSPKDIILYDFVWSDTLTHKVVKDDSTQLKTQYNRLVKTPVGPVLIRTTQHLTAKDLNRKIIVSHVNPNELADEYIKFLTVSLADNKADVLNLSFTSTNTDRATDVLNKMIEIYNAERVEEKKQNALVTSHFIEGRLMVLERELGGIDDDIEQYKSRQLLTNVEVEGAAYLGESNQYSTKTLEANNQLQIARFIRKSISKPQETPALLPSNSGLTDQGVSEMINEYNGLVMKRNRLIANSSTKNPLVVEIDRQLKDLTSSIGISLGNLIHTYEMQLASLQKQEGHIHQKIAQNPKQEKYLLSIGRQQKIKETLYLYLLQKREENELSGNIQDSNLRVITPPRGLDIPISPKTKQLLALALIMGFCLPVGSFWLADYMNTAVRGKSDLSSLSIPYLGDIPLCAKIKDKSKEPMPVRVVVKDHSRNNVNESFRVLRTNFLFMTSNANANATAAGNQGCRTIMFTSFYQNSGKTFISVNLALSLALIGKKVLLVDLDMRKGELSKFFTHSHEGISSYLSGQSTDLHDCIIPTNLNAKLDILPCGVIPPNPAELLMTSNLTAAFDGLRSSYDYIFVDCTPLNIVADASIVGKMVDMVLFVLRVGKFQREALPDLETLYTDHSFKRMATILNGSLDQSNGHYGRYGHYGSYGSYGHYGSYGTYGAGNEDTENL